MTKTARIIGTGSYLPERVLSNVDLEKMVDTSDDWILTRTGMKERRLAHENEHTSFMGSEAAKKAMEDAGVAAADIDMILVATLSPDYAFPSTAAIIQADLKAEKAAALDFQAACTGYVYGLSLARAYVESGLCKNVLLIASEKLSSIVDYEDRTTCVLFGDGAGASVISDEGEGLAIKHVCLGADGNQAELLIMPAGGSRHPASKDTVERRLHYLKMDGKEVFKHAVRRMEAAANQCLKEVGIKMDDIRWLVPHQANIRIINALAKRFEMPDDRVFKTIHKYGNTSASSVIIALDELRKEQPIKSEEHLLLVAFGAGLTWGASVLTQT